MARRKRKKGPACPNCGTELRAEFEFCPRCGQENHDMRVPFGQLFMDFLGSLTNFDTKLWSTLKVIVLRPGLLTKDYVEGRRARYVVPGRFYLFVSVIFFTLLNVLLNRSLEDGTEQEVLAVQPRMEWSDLRRSELDVVLGKARTRSMGWSGAELDDLNIEVPIDTPHYRRTADRLRPAPGAILDSLLAGKDTLPGVRERLRRSLALLPVADSLDVPFVVAFNGMPASFDNRAMEALFRKGQLTDAQVDSMVQSSGQEVNALERRLILSFGRMDLERSGDKRRLVQAMLSSTSLIMFLLMPFAALLLLGFFAHRRYYWEHLIFSLHVHAILFLFASLYMAVALVTDLSWPTFVNMGFLLGCVLYLLLSLRTVYQRGWRSTLQRTALMAIPYTTVMVILLLAGLLWGVINL